MTPLDLLLLGAVVFAGVRLYGVFKRRGQGGPGERRRVQPGDLRPDSPRNGGSGPARRRVQPGDLRPQWPGDPKTNAPSGAEEASRPDQPGQAAPQDHESAPEDQASRRDPYADAARMWEHLAGHGPGKAAKPAEALSTGSPAAGSDFEREDFLAGAKAMYARISESWEARDLEDLRQFTTPAAFRSEERRVGKECRSRWSPYH